MLFSRNKPPRDEKPSSTSRLVDANRLFERDILLDAPRREPRLRASIIGDKKLTARDVVTKNSTNGKKSSGGRGAEPVDYESKYAESRYTESKYVESKKAESKNVEKKSVSDSKRNTESRNAEPTRQVEQPRAESAKPSEKRSRVVFDDPITTRADTNLRRERGYKKVSPQRGSRNSESQSHLSAVDEVRAMVSRKIIYRGVGLGLLLCIFAVAAYFVTDPLTKLLERPLKSVAVEGEFQYLSKDRAMELIAAEIDGDFLQLDLNHLKAVLQQDSWVEHVYLSRRWPDTLVVKISEQQPIARWDANGFLNQRGEIIRVKETDKLLGLPWLQGNEINAREIMQQYQDMAKLLRSRGLEIIALKCDNKKSWRLTLKNDVEIAIGRDQVMEKLRRFVTVYDKFLNSVWGDVKAIDVRYTNGVSVRWAEDSEMAKKYIKPDVSAVKK